MPRKTPTPQTLTIQASQFRQITSHVLPMVGKGWEMPVLTTVLIERHDNHVTATATDRFRLGVSRVPVYDGENNETTDDFTALVDQQHVKRILTLFKAARRGDDPVLRMTVTDNGLRVERVGGIFDLAEASITVPLVKTSYPAVRQLLAEFRDPKPITDLRFNPCFLADFQHARIGQSPLLVWGSGDNKTLLVTIGDHFIGLLMKVMPGRKGTDETASLLESWGDFIPAKTEPAAVEAVSA